jgi:hypothetical protein
MISLQEMDEELEKIISTVKPEQEPKVSIPWDKIDEWIATIDLKEKGEPKVIDPGARRN